MFTAVVNLDAEITNWIFNLPHSAIFNYFFGFFAVRGATSIIWLALLVSLVFFEAKRHKDFIVCFMLALMIATFAYTSLKQIIKRPRPLSTNSNQFQPILTNYPTDYSFPSGHATISFATATILSAFDKKRKRYFYLLAALISCSRVYLGYHYVFDVITGALLGWIISWTLLIKLKMKNEKVKTTA